NISSGPPLASVASLGLSSLDSTSMGRSGPSDRYAVGSWRRYMLAVRPVNPPRPSSSSFSPSRSACRRRGVVPLRRWMKDSMAAPRLRQHPGKTKLKVTLLSVLARHKSSHDTAPVGSQRRTLVPYAYDDFAFGGAILQRRDRSGRLVPRVAHRRGGSQSTRGDQLLDCGPLLRKRTGVCAGPGAPADTDHVNVVQQQPINFHRGYVTAGEA